MKMKQNTFNSSPHRNIDSFGWNVIPGGLHGPKQSVKSLLISNCFSTNDRDGYLSTASWTWQRVSSRSLK